MPKDQNQDGFIQQSPHQKYTDFATVESQRNDLTAEEFPEGPYGTSLPLESLGKSTPWRDDQRSNNRFSYENRELHAGLPRNYPGEHPTHSSSGDEYEE
ncbi:hypothetical protein [Paenibacillus sp. YYML68]|uniref:hypothetical protein n=1 Tax=Paenibacillus sp. YYML68 TaxID=2909250 RepID=UPI00248F8364|nr:hypothetical protein [Paenibacillus sp. YYML68]